MPNWCHNKLTFWYTPENVDNIIKHITINGRFSFETLVQIPKGINDVDIADHWGTDRNAVDSDITKVTEDTRAFLGQRCEVCIKCDTAWVPPIPVIEAFEAKYGSYFEFTAYEPDMGFTVEWERGSLLKYYDL